MPNVELVIKGKDLSEKAFKQLKKNVEDTTKALATAENATIDVTDQSQKAGRSLTGLATTLGFVSVALGLQTRSMIQAGIQMDKIQRMLGAVAGGAANALTQFEDLKEVAKLPGLGLQEAIQGSVNLQAVGFSADMAKRSLMAFGNALATVGKGREELFGVILAMTQIKAKGKVMGQEILQLGERLPQIRKAMQDAFGSASTEELAKMGLTAEKFLEGVVAQLEKLPKVTGGAANAVENFHDALFQLRSSLAANIMPAFTNILESIASMMEKFNAISPEIKKFISTTLVATTAITSLGATAIGVALVMPHLKGAIVSIGAALTAMAGHPIILAVAALSALVAGIYLHNRAQKEAVLNLSKANKAYEQVAGSANKYRRALELTDKLEELAKKTEKTTEEEQELKDVKEELIKISPRFIASLTDENKTLEEQAEQAKKITADLKILSDERKKVAKAEAMLAVRETGKQTADLTRKANDLREEIASMEYQIEWTKKRFGTAARTETLERQLEKRQTDLGEILTQLDEANAKRNEALQIIREIEGIDRKAQVPVREEKAPYKPTDDQIKAINELKLARIEALKVTEDELQVTVKTEQEKVRQAEQAAEREKQLLKEDLIGAEAYAAEIERIENTLTTVRLKADTTIAMARKDAADKALQIQEEYIDKYTKAMEEDAKRYQKVQEEKVEYRRQTLEQSYRHEMSAISLITNEFDRERAEAYSAYRYRSSLLQQRLEDAKAKGESTLQIEAEMNQERITWERRIAEITKKEAEDKTERQIELATKTFEAETAYLRYIANLETNEFERRRKLLEVEYQENRHNLTKIVNDTKASTEERAVAKKWLAELETDYIKQVAQINKEEAQSVTEFIKRKALDSAEVWKKIVKERRQEEEKTYDEWVRLESARIGLMDEGLAKELASIDLRYMTEEDQIKSILRYSEMSAERRMYLEDQLTLLAQEHAKARVEAYMNYYGLIKQTVMAIASMPGDMIRLFAQAKELAKQANAEMADIEAERVSELRKIRAEEEMTAAEKARAIERLEQESADRRLAIEKKLNEDRGRLFEDYFKNFFMGILAEMEQMMQDLIAKQLMGYIQNQLLKTIGTAQATGGTGGGGGIQWGSVIAKGVIGMILGGPTGALMGAGSEIVGGMSVGSNEGLAPIMGSPEVIQLKDVLGFDVPEHDEMAYNYGRKMSLLVGASFDDPYNDALARLKGTQQAARNLGQRSAKDMLDNFVSGFNQEANRQASPDDTNKLIDAIKNVGFSIYLDGRQIQAVVMGREDKDRLMGNGR